MRWRTEKRKVKIVDGFDSIGRKRRFIYKKCEHCGKFFKTTNFDIKRGRKYCSRRCWSFYCAKNLKDWTNPQKIAKRNKEEWFRKRVGEGLRRYYTEKVLLRRLKRRDNFDYGWTGWERIIRKKILKRDIVCQMCGSKKNLRVHHIIPIRAGGTEDENNLITVCNKCHQIIEKNQYGIFKIVQDWDIVRILVLDSLLFKRVLLNKIYGR